MPASPAHLVLLGDSVFDNGPYTGEAPDVITHLRHLLPPDWTATLCAVDGATTRAIDAQLTRVPATATHIVLSIGGNDALENRDMLFLPARSTADALALFGDRLA